MNMGLFLEPAFLFLPGIVDDGNEFSLNHSLQLVIDICLYSSMEEHVFAI